MKNLLSAASLSQGVTTAGGVACLIYQSFMLNVLPEQAQREFVQNKTVII